MFMQDFPRIAAKLYIEDFLKEIDPNLIKYTSTFHKSIGTGWISKT